MDFRIADTFTESLAKLTGDEQKLVKTTAFDLQKSGVRFQCKAVDQYHSTVCLLRFVRIDSSAAS